MKVSELIETLSSLDPDSDVVVNGYEGGYCDVASVKPIALLCNVHEEWYYGAHERDDEFNRTYHKGEWNSTKRAVLISAR